MESALSAFDKTLAAAEAAKGIILPSADERVRPPRNADKDRRRRARAAAKRQSDEQNEDKAQKPSSERRGSCSFKQSFIGANGSISRH